MNHLFLYFFAISENISGVALLFCFLYFFSLCAAILFGFIYAFEKDEKPKFIVAGNIFQFKYWALFALIINTLIPNKNDIALIYIAPKIVESSVIQNDMPELYKLGIDALKDQLKKQVKHD